MTESKNPAVYWRVLKKRLSDEGSDQTVTKCNALKMPAADGKKIVSPKNYLPEKSKTQKLPKS